MSPPSSAFGELVSRGRFDSFLKSGPGRDNLDSKARNGDCTVVLGVLNEVDSLPRVAEGILRELGSNTRIVIVDDGSTDGTREWISQAIRAGKPITPVYNSAPQTLSRALSQGLGFVTTDLAIFMDADLQHPTTVLRDVIGALREGNGLVVASRYLPGASPGARSPIRGLISRVACAAAKLAVPESRLLSDPVSGFFGLRVASLEDVPRAPRGFEFLLSVLGSLDVVRTKVVEIPYTFGERHAGRSKIVQGVTFAALFLSQLLELRRARYRQTWRTEPRTSSGLADPEAYA